MKENLTTEIEAFFALEKWTQEEVIKKDHVFVVKDKSKKKMVVKIDPIVQDRESGRRYGIAKGGEYNQQQNMEQAFSVMKDFRFFRLCLPAVFGMGRYNNRFDWVLYKYYDGKRYKWSEKNDDEDIIGGKAVPVATATEMAMMICDLAQVPVLKFSKKVLTKNYIIDLEEIKKQLKDTNIEGISNEQLKNAVEQLEAFYEKKLPTLYVIQNGDFYPRNMVKMQESIVLIDWESVGITTVEEVIAYAHMLMWNNPKWQEAFLSEVRALLDVREEWLQKMQLYCTLKQMIFWAEDPKEKLGQAQEAMRKQFFHVVQEA